MKLTAPRKIPLLVAAWLRLSTVACSIRVNSTRSNTRSSEALLDAEHRFTLANKSTRYGLENARKQPDAQLYNIKANLWEQVKPGSDCIADSEVYDSNSFTLCCEGLRPCEQVYGDIGKRIRFFICLEVCIPTYFRGQGPSTMRALIGSQFDEAHDDLKLTRFLSNYDEQTYKDDFAVKPKIKVLSVRPYDKARKARFASPFEHVCGGNAISVNRANGNDGPSQFISFTNAAGKSRRKTQECAQPFDKGQRRIKTGSKDVLDSGGVVVDLSNEYKAFKWCYEGGCVHAGTARDAISKHTQLCFEGARTAKPWPFACATRAYQVAMKQSTGTVPPGWWTDENRVEIARSCATWAVRAKEVLVLPDPRIFTITKMKKFMKGESTKIQVTNDRDPALEQCDHSDNEDHCTSYNTRTRKVCCSKTPMAGCSASSRS